jgi:hypothetical protein
MLSQTESTSLCSPALADILRSVVYVKLGMFQPKHKERFRILIALLR